MRSTTTIPLGLVLVAATLFGRVGPPQSPAFNVKGTIKSAAGEPLYEAKVVFKGNEISKSLLTNGEGLYEIDLPVGDYTMTVQSRGFRPYLRPLFRVTEPVALVFDVTLREYGECDVEVFNGSGKVTPEEWAAAQKESCLHEDLLAAPSQGTPFQISIRYGSRSLTAGVHLYQGEMTGRTRIPVFITYNIFSLQADQIVLDLKRATIEADGNVVDVNEPDTIKRGDLMKFEIKNGRVLPKTHTQTFRVKGTITAPDGSGISATRIVFKSKLLDKTVTADAGAFEANLTWGDYTMIAQSRLFRTRRVQFRAASPKTVVLNLTAYPMRMTCDLAWGSNQEQNVELAKENCGGEDSFSIPSDRGPSFELDFQYPQRNPADGGYVYRGDRLGGGDLTPVFVEYNLFVLQADEVRYNVKERTIRALGNVVIEDESGKHYSDSAIYKIENGKATLLP